MESQISALSLPLPAFLVFHANALTRMEEVKPYNHWEGKKKQVAGMFDNIAHRYDFLNHFLSLGIDIFWRKKAIQALQSLQPKTILDVATGTADLAIEAERQLRSAKITGIDIAAEMLEIGRQKLERYQLGHKIELLQGDVENLPFPNNTFDAVTVAFGVRNFEDISRGLEEMQRVLRPGGKVVILEFSTPTLFPIKQLYNFYFKNILPVFGKIASKDPRAYTYLYESVQVFPYGRDFANLLEETGFQPATYKPLTGGICTLYLAEK